MQKYQLGETYGKTTANILTDDTVSINYRLSTSTLFIFQIRKSGELVLVEKKVQGDDCTPPQSLRSLRDNSWGDRKLNSHMVSFDK